MWPFTNPLSRVDREKKIVEEGIYRMQEAEYVLLRDECKRLLDAVEKALTILDVEYHRPMDDEIIQGLHNATKQLHANLAQYASLLRSKEAGKGSRIIELRRIMNDLLQQLQNKLDAIFGSKAAQENVELQTQQHRALSQITALRSLIAAENAADIDMRKTVG